MAIAPPRPKPAPLNALRAFEASARLGGFSAAAQELCVTPGAVAQQVKQLERWAGAPLFNRKAQGLELSTLGRQVAADLSKAFDLVGMTSQKLRRLARPTRIAIAALPSIAQLWLSPRLPEIRSANPELEISVTAMEERPNLRREPYDIAIFFIDDSEIERDATLQVLARDRIFPVCTPEIARDLRGYEDLAGHVLLHDSAWRDDWERWFDETCPEIDLSSEGPSHSLYSLALEEARNGAGILLGHEALVSRLIGTGELVHPFDAAVTLARSMCLETSPSARHRPEIDALVASLSE